MKKVLYLLISVLATTSLLAQTKAPLEFTNVKHSFGKVKQGVPVTYTFDFKNVSDKPVVIENATAQCGCTTPEYPKGAISKGAAGKIKVTYNAAAMGAFTKQVTVKVANVTEPIILNIEGEVVTTNTPANTGAATASTANAKTQAAPKTKAGVSKSTSVSTTSKTVKQ